MRMAEAAGIFTLLKFAMSVPATKCRADGIFLPAEIRTGGNTTWAAFLRIALHFLPGSRFAPDLRTATGAARRIFLSMPWTGVRVQRFGRKEKPRRFAQRRSRHPQNGGALNGVVFERMESAIRFGERKKLDVGFDGDLGGDA